MKGSKKINKKMETKNTYGFIQMAVKGYPKLVTLREFLKANEMSISGWVTNLLKRKYDEMLDQDPWFKKFVEEKNERTNQEKREISELEDERKQLSSNAESDDFSEYE